jgi:hypothetical protein
LKSGEPETPVTSPGEGELEYRGIAKLYHLRRGIKTKYKSLCNIFSTITKEAPI